VYALCDERTRALTCKNVCQTHRFSCWLCTLCLLESVRGVCALYNEPNWALTCENVCQTHRFAHAHLHTHICTRTFAHALPPVACANLYLPHTATKRDLPHTATTNLWLLCTHSHKERFATHSHKERFATHSHIERFATHSHH